MKITSTHRTVDGWHVRYCPLCEREIMSPVAFWLTLEFVQYCQAVGVHQLACMECVREAAAGANS